MGLLIPAGPRNGSLGGPVDLGGTQALERDRRGLPLPVASHTFLHCPVETDSSRACLLPQDPEGPAATALVNEAGDGQREGHSCLCGRRGRPCTGGRAWGGPAERGESSCRLYGSPV